MPHAMRLVFLGLAAVSLGCTARPQDARTQQAVPAMYSYIVTLQPATADVPGEARRLAALVGGEVGQIYQSALKGFSLRTTAEGAERLRRDPAVIAVEADAPVRLQPPR